MAALPSISFVKPVANPSGTVVILTDDQLQLGPRATALRAGKLLERAAPAADFKGRSMSSLDLLAPTEPALDRLIVVGLGKLDKFVAQDWMRLGGSVAGWLRRGQNATVILERPDGNPVTADEAADFALGAALRSYSFDKYKGDKSEKDGDENGDGAKKPPAGIAIATDDPTRAKRAWASRAAVSEGVYFARDLVNEPANVLGPVEFADRVKALEASGVSVEVLTEKDLKKLGMNAYLGVGQGSAANRQARLVVLRWEGGKAKDKPLALIGKGVVFDTGGISIKPALGMEDMKGDMGGAAAVTGTLLAIAQRKAKANVVGLLGLVENMPDANAQRPGDIVTSMSGQTVEIINTDAEGRLVLCDVLTYAQRRFAPKAMIDLATLTGAIIVALGKQYAGLFASDDELAASLTAAGEATGEKVWRMPMGAEYDKALESKFADVKHVGSRDAGSITAAQFLKRFVKDVPWAHLDIAGTAMASPPSEINKSWASGFGVRLLDRLIADKYEG